MIIDGKYISDTIKKTLASFLDKKKCRLDIVYIGEHKTIERYIRAKKKFGQDIGVDVFVHTFPDISTQKSITDFITATSKSTNGIIIQLPLPGHLDKSTILNTVPVQVDIDMLSAESQTLFEKGISQSLPPVVGACKEIIDFHSINLKNKSIVVLGSGGLVGKPIATWLRHQGYSFMQFSKETFSLESLKNADVIFCGIGVSHFVKPEMIKEGVVILDAGTSEESKTLFGDVHPACADKASFFTPVPGGIGPITVACLFKNMITLYHES